MPQYFYTFSDIIEVGFLLMNWYYKALITSHTTLLSKSFPKRYLFFLCDLQMLFDRQNNYTTGMNTLKFIEEGKKHLHFYLLLQFGIFVCNFHFIYNFH